MTKFLKDIESIGFEIEMISLNAIVKSSNLGSDGKALTVLAESIKRLSEDASVEVLKISQAFEEIGAAAAVLKKTADKGSKALFGEINSLHDDLSSVLSTMGAADKHVGESLFQINLQAKALSKDSERQITNFQAHHTYRSVLLKTSAELMKIIGQTNAAADAHTAGDMQELSTRYTMDSERALHRTILSADIESGQAEKPPAVEEALVGSSDKDDFGDNIQLF